MWYKVESWDISEPAPFDDTSSKKVVYVRKDIKAVQIEVPSADGETEIKDGYEWMEQKIPKADWEVYRMAFQNTSDISDNTDAIVELAGLIAGIMEG